MDAVVAVAVVGRACCSVLVLVLCPSMKLRTKRDGASMALLGERGRSQSHRRSHCLCSAVLLAVDAACPS